MVRVSDEIVYILLLNSQASRMDSRRSTWSFNLNNNTNTPRGTSSTEAHNQRTSVAECRFPTLYVSNTLHK